MPGVLRAQQGRRCQVCISLREAGQVWLCHWGPAETAADGSHFAICHASYKLAKPPPKISLQGPVRRPGLGIPEAQCIPPGWLETRELNVCRGAVSVTCPGASPRTQQEGVLRQLVAATEHLLCRALGSSLPASRFLQDFP